MIHSATDFRYKQKLTGIDNIGYAKDWLEVYVIADNVTGRLRLMPTQ